MLPKRSAPHGPTPLTLPAASSRCRARKTPSKCVTSSPPLEKRLPRKCRRRLRRRLRDANFNRIVLQREFGVGDALYSPIPSLRRNACYTLHLQGSPRATCHARRPPSTIEAVF